MKNITLLLFTTLAVSHRILLSVPSGDNIKSFVQTDRPINREKNVATTVDADQDASNEEVAEVAERIRVCFHYDSKYWYDGSNHAKEDQNVLDWIRILTQGAGQVMRNILSLFKPEYSPIYEQLDEIIDIPEYLIEDDTTHCDLMILVGLFKGESNQFIEQINIQVNEVTNRPEFAVMWFNFQHGQEEYQKKFEYFQKLTLQAVLQCAGFSHSLFPYFKVDPRLVENNRIYIVSSKALQAAREHFGCADISKLPLENDVDMWGLSQRWDQTFLFNDLLSNAIIGSNHVLTKITLSVFEDSGWYKPNYTFAEDTFWGRNQGCAFVNCVSNYNCGNFWEFCKEQGKQGIEPFFSGLGTCRTLNFLDFPVNIRKYYDCVAPELVDSNELRDTYEIVSRRSVAFLSSFNMYNDRSQTETEFRCFDYSIISSDTMIIQVGQNSVYCTQAEESQVKTISGIYGNLVCPSRRLWDYKRNDCFGDCGNFGYCHAGECICYKGSYKDITGQCRCYVIDQEICLHLYKDFRDVYDWNSDEVYEGGYGVTSEEESSPNGQALIVILSALNMFWVL